MMLCAIILADKRQKLEKTEEEDLVMMCREICQIGQELGCRGRLYRSCVEVWREFRVGR